MLIFLFAISFSYFSPIAFIASSIVCPEISIPSIATFGITIFSYLLMVPYIYEVAPTKDKASIPTTEEITIIFFLLF